MRTSHTQGERRETIPQAEIKNHGFFATALGGLLLFVAMAAPALAEDAVWGSGNPTPPPIDGNWNSGGNWVGGIAPVNAGDTATFNTSTITSLELSGTVTIDSMTFNSGASAFTIDTIGNSFSFVGVGIVNNSNQTQTIRNVVGGSTNFLNSSTAGNVTLINDFSGFTSFLNSSSAGTATIMNINGGSGGGVTNFRNTSTAANANITNSGQGTATNFFDTSMAGNATIQNDSFGTTNFNDSSHADSATIQNFGGTTNFNDTSTADSATIQNELGLTGGQTFFLNNSTAGNATISNANSNSGPCLTEFHNASTAGNAMITSEGGDSSNPVGGVTRFDDTSTAGNATLIANGGSGGGGGGIISFEGDSTGDTARVEVFGNGRLDISSHSILFVTIGSIEGDGEVLLGTNSLNVGSNNLSTLFSGVIQGSGGFLTKVGTGTLTLSGTNTYTGLTTVSAGILNIQNGSALGATTDGTVVLGIATLQLQGGISVGTEELLIEGPGATGQNGALVNVSGTNNYAGLLTLGSDSTISSDSGTLNLTNTGTITGTEGQPFDLTLTGAGDGTISSIIGTGTGTLTKNGAGTWTLNGVNTYTGLTTVTAGTLAEGVSNAISTGDLTINGATAIFDLGANHSDSVGIVTLDGGGSITGTGTSTLTSTGSFEMKSGTASAILDGSVALNKTTTGTVTLTGLNTYTGPTTLDAGTLLVDGSLAEPSVVTVNSGATLGGTGTAAGAVTIADGGILAPGHNGPGTFTLGSFSLGNASLLNYDLGTPGVIGSQVNDLTIVRGNLTLDGVLNTTALAGFGPGAYRLFNYGGALTDNTLDIGTVPPGFLASNFTVITGLPNEVDLLVLPGQPPPMQFWDGPNTTPNGVIDGGTGEWDNSRTNWTNASGNNNSNWQNDVAVFAGTAGIVTVTQPIFFAGMEFMTDRYQIDQGVEASLNLIGSPFITTDTGVTATINATLNGAGGITKEGPGTLILTAANTYLGITTINAGVLSISSDANLGTAPGAPVADQLTFNGGTLQATASFDLATNRGITLLGGGGTIEVTGANTLSYAGSISGTGNLTKVGTGTQILRGENFYTGTTFVNDGTLTLVSGVLTRQHIIIGPLIIGDDVGVPNTATVVDGIIGDVEPKFGVHPPVPVTVNSDGLFVVNVGIPSLGQGQGVGQLVINRGNVRVEGSLLPGFDPGGQQTLPLEMNGGSISGAGTLVLPDVTATSDASGNAARISANAKLPDASRVLTVNDGPGSTDLLISGVIFQDTVPVGITKEGAGTLVLTGANTYLGITTINAGVLSISSDANLGTAPSPAPVPDQLTFNGGTLQATASFDLDTNRGITLLGDGTIGVTDANILTCRGVITGTGSLTKTDTGTLLLSGMNTYKGATAVNGGTLAAGAINTLPSQTALTVATGATFDLNNFSQSIGSLAGAGSVTLGAATLTTGNDNTSTDFSGAISGPGGLTKVGTGTLTLTGLNTYGGITAINAGILSISSDGNLGTGRLFFDGGTLQATASFDLDTNRGITLLGGGGTIGVTGDNIFRYEGVITGAGSLTKTDAGTLVLSGKNTYAGVTAVNGGSLIVDGSIASAQTFVNAGGLLGGGPAIAEAGRGIIGGDLTNSGIVSPGNSPGTLTVNGNYTQNANGTLRIEVAGLAPTAHDLLAINGTANLAGTLQVIRLNNFKFSPGDQITFLSANGVNGTFNPVINPFAISGTIVAVQIVYLPGGVELEATQGSFTEVACNPNTLAVAKALNSAVGDPRASGLIDFLDMQPLSELCGDFELIAPDELPAMFNIGVSLANIQSVNLARRMEDIRAGSSGFSATGFTINTRGRDFNMGLAGPTGPEGKSGPSVMQPTPQNRWGVFVTGLGEFTDVDSTSVAPGYNFSTGGLTFGVDYRVSPNFAIGLTGGYANTNANLVNNGSLDVNGGTIGAYATGFGGGFYFDAAAFGVFNGYDSHRTALLGTASGDTDGQDFNALVAGGYDWKHGGLTIGPLASFQYSYVGLDGFTEQGSLAPLSFSNQNAESTRTALGAKASYDWHVGHVVVRPEIRASWQHEFGDTDYSIVSRFANGAGNSFTVNGPAIGRDSLLIGAGAAVMFNDRVSVYAYYDGELARTNYSSNNVSAGVRVNF